MLSVHIMPHQIQENTVYAWDTRLKGFPLITIDEDSYISGLQIDSSLEVYNSERYCVCIGKGCSLSESVTFMIDMNHEYGAVAQGEVSFLQGLKLNTIRRKGTIIIQNDVWIGHGATIMSGVTLHNGCVVGTDAVVTKDVPPYAIVGGNPARIIRYRFDYDTIAALQKIAWWDWPLKVREKRRNDFQLPPAEFAKKYLPEAEARLQKVHVPRGADERKTKTVLLIPDFSAPYPLYRKILEQYFAVDRPHLRLMIYLSAPESTPENLHILEDIFRQYEDRDCDVILQTGETIDEHILFQHADYFITTRSRETVFRTYLADLYQVKILYGTDEPMFPAELG